MTLPIAGTLPHGDSCSSINEYLVVLVTTLLMKNGTNNLMKVCYSKNTVTFFSSEVITVAEEAKGELSTSGDLRRIEAVPSIPWPVH